MKWRTLALVACALVCIDLVVPGIHVDATPVSYRKDHKNHARAVADETASSDGKARVVTVVVTRKRGGKGIVSTGAATAGAVAVASSSRASQEVDGDAVQDITSPIRVVEQAPRSRPSKHVIAYRKTRDGELVPAVVSQSLRNQGEEDEVNVDPPSFEEDAEEVSPSFEEDVEEVSPSFEEDVEEVSPSFEEEAEEVSPLSSGSPQTPRELTVGLADDVWQAAAEHKTLTLDVSVPRALEGFTCKLSLYTTLVLYHKRRNGEGVPTIITKRVIFPRFGRSGQSTGHYTETSFTVPDATSARHGMIPVRADVPLVNLMLYEIGKSRRTLLDDFRWIMHLDGAITVEDPTYHYVALRKPVAIDRSVNGMPMDEAWLDAPLQETGRVITNPVEKPALQPESPGATATTVSDVPAAPHHWPLMDSGNSPESHTSAFQLADDMKRQLSVDDDSETDGSTITPAAYREILSMLPDNLYSEIGAEVDDSGRALGMTPAPDAHMESIGSGAWSEQGSPVLDILTAMEHVWVPSETENHLRSQTSGEMDAAIAQRAQLEQQRLAEEFRRAAEQRDFEMAQFERQRWERAHMERMGLQPLGPLPVGPYPRMHPQAPYHHQLPGNDMPFSAPLSPPPPPPFDPAYVQAPPMDTPLPMAPRMDTPVPMYPSTRHMFNQAPMLPVHLPPINTVAPQEPPRLPLFDHDHDFPPLSREHQD